MQADGQYSPRCSLLVNAVGTSVVTMAGICNSVGGGGRSSKHHALRVNHLSRSLLLTPHHNAHVNRRRRC